MGLQWSGMPTVAEISAMRLSEEETARSEFLARMATISSKYNKMLSAVNPDLSDHEFDSSAPHVEVLAAVAAGQTGFFAALFTAFLSGLQTGVAPAARVMSDLKEYGLFSEPLTKYGLLRYAQLTPSMPVWFGELLKELGLVHEISIEAKTRYPDLVIDWRILQYKERQSRLSLCLIVHEPQPSAIQRSDWTFEFGEHGGTVAAQGPCCTSCNAMYEIEVTCAHANGQIGVNLGWATHRFLLADGTHEIDPGITQISWGIAVQGDQVKPIWSTMLSSSQDLQWTTLAGAQHLKVGTILTMTLNAEKSSIALYLAGELVSEVLHQDTNHRPLFPVICGAPGTGVRVNLGQRSFAHPLEGFQSVLECATYENVSDIDVISACFDWLKPRQAPIRTMCLIAKQMDGMLKVFDSESSEEASDIARHGSCGEDYLNLNTLAETTKHQRAQAADEAAAQVKAAAQIKVEVVDCKVTRGSHGLGVKLALDDISILSFTEMPDGVLNPALAA